MIQETAPPAAGDCQHPPFVHEWFHAMARQQPRAIAIESTDGSMTYAALAARAYALSRRLHQEGARPGDLVALAVERRIDAIAAAIGILDAGCAFMPLPLEFPDARLALMLAEAPPRWVIADAAGARRLDAVRGPDRERLAVIALDAPPDATGVAPDGTDASPDGTDSAPSESAATSLTLPPANDPDALAYVVFTSGSTGRPKGIAGRLKAIDHFIRWEIDTLGLDARVRVSQLSSPAFDVFLRDVFTPLCAGGTICIPPAADIVLDGRAFADWIESQDIHLIHTVPSVFRVLGEQLDRPSQFEALRHVLLAGEPLLPTDVKRWTAVLGERVRIVNLYGPSETTMTKLWHPVTAADGDRHSVPIGTPMPGASALLMDEGGRVCGPGMVGELYIRTAYRTLGYYGRPDLTADVFLPNRFSQEADDLIYRTGDLARLLPDGAFEFVGRRDDQVKIRGVRVELGEIAAVLRGCRAVCDAAVIDREDGAGGRRLVAYVVLQDVPADDASPDAVLPPAAPPTVSPVVPPEGATRDGDGRGGAGLAAAQQHVAAHLPDVMTPSQWIVLDRLPRTPNGKLDRRALPALAAASPPGTAAAAQTPIQEIVAGIWAEVLRRPRVGLHESFFEIGGHSLLATRVIARLRRTFNVDLPLRTLFRAPTVAGLSAAIRTAVDDPAAVEAMRIRPADRRRPPPLSYGQQRLWFLQQLARGSAAYHVTFARQLVGDLDRGALRRALREIVRRHEVLRTAFPAPDGEPVQQIGADAALPLPLVDLAALPAASRHRAARRLVAAASALPFDLATGPLLHATLVSLGRQDDEPAAPPRHVLAMVMHHAVCDGWSMTIIAREVAALYQAFRQGMSSPLPELTLQYADYAAWERDWLSDERLDQHARYWRDRLHGMEPLELPLDAVRPPAASYTAGQIVFTLEPATSAAVQALARREGVTLFMLLLAAFTTVLARWSGQRTIVVGTDVANRESLEVEGLIGFFVNQLVLRTDLTGDPTFRELLHRVREMTLGAYAHQQFPFERLVETLAPVREVSRHPLYQVVFALRNTMDVPPRIEGLDLVDLPSAPPAVDFDLTLVMGEAGETISGVLLYAKELFAARTAARLTRHLAAVLDAAVQQPDRRVSELPVDTAAEAAHALPATRRADRLSEVTHGSVCEAIERYAAIAPNATAAEAGDLVLTYADLDRRANQLAHHLRALGVSSESVVAVCLSRGLELLVSFVAILKAGAAWLPIDPRHPADHARTLVRDARAVVLIASGSTAAAVGAGPLHLAPDTHRELIERLPADPPARVDDARGLAYVIYTSGSTGAPKGAMLEHQGLWNHLQAKIDDLQLTRDDVVAQNASSAFDISVWQMLAPLVSGGAVRIVGDDTAGDGRLLIDEVDRAGITVLEMVPALIDALVDDLEHRPDDRPALPRLRLLLSTGEALPAITARRWQALYPHVALVNAYGPTECSDDVTHHHVPVLTEAVGSDGPRADDRSAGDRTPARDTGGSGFVPLGQALHHTRLWVLDDVGVVAPTGAVGELYVGGRGVGRGYLRAPGTTAARFVPDPFGTHGERLFRTGDLARWNADGELEFLGRLDDQVKIRGFRVELGDAQAGVTAHPGVRQSLVCARAAAGGDMRLVAYVVPRRWSVFEAQGAYLLPDGSPVAERQRNETRYLYQRIFERQIYFQHGIELADDACILDVGANIGLFASRASELAPKGRVLAFEPIGPIADALRANVRPCRAAVDVLAYGLADREQEAAFAYYPGYSIMSGLAKYADAGADLDILKQYLRNERQQGSADAAEALAQADDLLADRLRSEICTARLRPLSDVWREQRLERVDLLKIDVQRAGLDVLRGIADEHWPAIDQIVMEVHAHVVGAPDIVEIERLLRARGYTAIVEQEPLLVSTELFNVYARRPGASRRADARPAARPLDPPVIVADLRERLRQRSPEYMVPSAFVFLPELPLTSSGKVDRAALPDPPASPPHARRDPRTAVEQAVAQVWQELLQIPAIGIDDDFFELGGHSLLATRVASRLRHLLRVDVPVRVMFEARTVEQLSRYLIAHEPQPGQTTKIAQAVARARQLSAGEREALLARARS